MLTHFYGGEVKKKEIKMADSKKHRFSKSQILYIFFQKFYGLFCGLVGLIDAKGIDVAQPIWSSGSCVEILMITLVSSPKYPLPTNLHTTVRIS